MTNFEIDATRLPIQTNVSIARRGLRAVVSVPLVANPKWQPGSLVPRTVHNFDDAWIDDIRVDGNMIVVDESCQDGLIAIAVGSLRSGLLV